MYISVFLPVDDLRSLVAKSGGRLQSRIYSSSVTMVASLDGGVRSRYSFSCQSGFSLGPIWVNVTLEDPPRGPNREKKGGYLCCPSRVSLRSLLIRKAISSLPSPFSSHTFSSPSVGDAVKKVFLLLSYTLQKIIPCYTSLGD